MNGNLTNLSKTELWQLRADVDAELKLRMVRANAEAEVIRLAAEFESAMTSQPATPWADLIDRIGPGQRIIWTDGNEWQNVSKAWLPTTATPDTYPLGYRQLIGLPDPVDVLPFTVGEAVQAGDLRELGGIIYRAVQAHTTQADYAPNLPGMTALWVVA